MPAFGSGKVMVGQQVNIKLDNYPYYDYGMIEGKVLRKSIIPTKDSYVLLVELSDDLVSSNKTNIKFDREMKGNAEIITAKARLMNRIFNKFRSLKSM